MTEETDEKLEAGVTLEAVARRLYEVGPEDFVAHRKALATQVRGFGDAALARQVAALRKPTRAAWVVNLLVRREPARVDELVGLGEQLRDAQEQQAGPELRALASQRRTLIGDAVTAARRHAADASAPMSDAIAEQVSQTLQAALADSRAAAALETALLVDTFASTGFEDVDLDGKVAVPEAVSMRPRRRTPRKPSDTEPTKKAGTKRAGTKAKKAAQPSPPKLDAKAAARARRAAADLAMAEEALGSASQRTAAAREQAESVLATVQSLAQRRTSLREELTEVESALADARKAESSARKERTAAERDEGRARRAVESQKTRG